MTGGGAPADWREVLEGFGLGGAHRIEPIGGTAGRKVRVATGSGRFVARRRPAEFSAAHLVRWDHAWRTFLADAGFPAPRPLPARDGGTSVRIGTETFELSPVLPGSVVPEPGPEGLREAGRTIARLHLLGRDFPLTAKENFPREDHLSLLAPLLPPLLEGARTPGERDALEGIRGELIRLHGELDEGFYASLEHSVIHGDFHPGNVLYAGDSIRAVLDYDYANREPVLRDIADGLILFASGHPHGFDPDDIVSLTGVWTPSVERARLFLSGYASVRGLPRPLEAMGPLMLSRWIMMRLRGSRKVPEERRVAYVLREFQEPVRFLREGLGGFLRAAALGL